MSVFPKLLVTSSFFGGVLGVAVSVHSSMQTRTLLEVLKQENPGVAVLDFSEGGKENIEHWKSKVEGYKKENQERYKIENFVLEAAENREEANIKALKGECSSLSNVRLNSKKFKESMRLFKRWCLVR